MAYIQNVQTGVEVQPNAARLETTIYLSQNENGRKLYIKIFGIDSIPSGSVATLSGTKPDGVVYSATGTIDDITVIFNENTQMTAVAGVWDARIKITSAGNTVATAKVRFVIEPDTVAPGSIPSDSELEGIIAECQAYTEEARSSAYGSPLTAATASAMMDTNKVYVYVGEETGYVNGNWYYWDGTAWTSGGIYNAVAVEGLVKSVTGSTLVIR